MADESPLVSQPLRKHTMLLFLAYQLPLIVLFWWHGPCPLLQTAEYNLAGITAWCVLRRYVWKDSANCMACSLFCTFTVWTIHVALDALAIVPAFGGMKALLAIP